MISDSQTAGTYKELGLGDEQVLVRAHAAEYDAILDMRGSRPLTALRRHLTPAGRLVMVGGEEGGRFIGTIGRSLVGVFRSAFGHQKFITFLAIDRAPDLEFLAGLIEAGKVKPAIERTYPLGDTAQAIRHLEAGRARGKLVIRVADDC